MGSVGGSRVPEDVHAAVHAAFGLWAFLLVALMLLAVVWFATH